jgi:hypothetical protein
MSVYTEQARKFMQDCNATMKFMYLGKEANADWDDNKERDIYIINIVTPKGNMQVKFWDSISNTIKNSYPNRARIYPTVYDILSCLQKYDVGTIDDFMSEFGYEVNEWADVKRIQNIYNAVVKEYNDVCRCFTEEQIEAMQEIQ